MLRSLSSHLGDSAKTVGGTVPLAAFSAALVGALLIWERWVHIAIFGFPDEDAPSFAVTFLRDMPVLLVLAAVAVATAYKLSDRLPNTIGHGLRRTWRAVGISALFGALIAVAVTVGDMLFAGATVTTAPGAGYLTSGQGFLTGAAHGLTDALVAQLILLPVAFVGVDLLRRRTEGGVRQEPTLVPKSPTPEAAPGPPLTDSRKASLLSRREALQYGTAGTFAMALGSGGLVTLTTDQAHAATPTDVTPWLSEGISLYINEGTKQMIDGTPVYMWGWGFESEGVDDQTALHTPGPVIWTYEGETVELSITNTLNEDHNFSIDGIVDSGIIAPGETVPVSFAAPAAGTYLYQDSLNGPVNRVLGLNGALLVMPADRSMRSSAYLDQQYWEFSTQWVWMLNEIDPTFNGRAQADLPIDPDDFINRFKPRYFTINGRMGSLAAHEETAPDTVVHDHIGNPALIRIVNAGAAMHGPHIHGNHVYRLAHNAKIENPIMWKDTLRVMPGDSVDVFLPFAIPPNAVHFPPPQEGQDFLERLHGKKMEGKWPMHCHVEMSQTAGGGLYPQGMLTDWSVEL